MHPEAPQPPGSRPIRLGVDRLSPQPLPGPTHTAHTTLTSTQAPANQPALQPPCPRCYHCGGLHRARPSTAGYEIKRHRTKKTGGSPAGVGWYGAGCSSLPSAVHWGITKQCVTMTELSDIGCHGGVHHGSRRLDDGVPVWEKRDRCTGHRGHHPRPALGLGSEPGAWLRVTPVRRCSHVHHSFGLAHIRFLAQPCLSFGFARRVVCVCACVCAVSLCTCRAFLLVASRP